VPASNTGVEFVDGPKFTHDGRRVHPTIRCADVEVSSGARVLGYTGSPSGARGQEVSAG